MKKSLLLTLLATLFILFPKTALAAKSYCGLKGRVLMKTFDSLDNPNIERVNVRVIAVKDLEEYRVVGAPDCSTVFAQGQVVTVVFPKNQQGVKGANVIETSIRLPEINSSFGVLLVNGKPDIKVVEEYGYGPADVLSITSDLSFGVSEGVGVFGKKLEHLKIAVELFVGIAYSQVTLFLDQIF